ncbi:MAG TPA: TPM domain-containing protein [Fontimonas sp.]
MRPTTIAAGLLAAASLSAWALQDIPPSSLYVDDPAGVIGPELIPTMEMLLGQVADSGGARIAVRSVADLQGEPAGQYALRALYEWPGGDGATQSSLLLLAPGGVVALATGGELRPRMSRAEAEAVLTDALLPSAAESDMTTAVLNAAQSVMVSLMSEEGGASGDPFAVVARFGADGSAEVVDEGLEEGLAPMTADDGTLAFDLDPERWVNEATTALRPALEAAGRDPLGFLAQARGELQALPAVLDVASSQPTVPEQVVTRYILLGLSIGLCVFAWRMTRSTAALLGVMGVLGGLWIWQLSGFAALALCAMVAGVLLLPLAKLAVVLLRGAASRDSIGAGRTPTVGPSQGYQEWLAAQRAKSAKRSDGESSVAVASKPAPTRTPAAAPKPAPAAAGGRLPGGMIDNRSVAARGPQQNLASRLASDRDRLHEAGIATPAIDQLLSSRGVLDRLSKRKLQMAAIGAVVAIAVFGPIAVFGLIVAAVLWGRKLWSQVKPAHMNTGDFLKQVAREAEAATKLRR